MLKESGAKKGKTFVWLIAGLAIGLVIGAGATYLIFSSSHNNFNKGNFGPMESFQINDSIKEEIASFFESSPAQEQIDDYCRQNMMYCTYYCRNIDSENEICATINSQGPGGNPNA
jgi:hypothetical protein